MINSKYLDLVRQIFDYCNKYKLKICVAESCTGGLLSTYFTYLPGSSKFFEKGLVTYSNHSKTQLLNISPDILANYSAVSFETAMLMAQNISLGHSDYLSLATTGVLGPDNDGTNPIGLVYIGCNTKNELLKVQKLMLNGSRHEMQDQVVGHILNLAIDNLNMLS
jgi:PncC family amidohydrolase